MKPVCSKCETSMTVVLTGVTVLETYLDPPQPYRVWQADELMCLVCGARVIARFGDRYHRPDEVDLAAVPVTDRRLWLERGRRRGVTWDEVVANGKATDG